MLSLLLAIASIAASPPPLLQSWSDTGLIAADDDWSRVPAFVGYRGNGLVAEPGIDPRSVTADGSSTPVDVTANRADPRAVGLAAGVAEFELADPVVAIQGSATASAPHLVISLDTRGRSGISVRLVLRDIDASGADAVEPVAIQYRVGAADSTAGGAFTAAPGGYVADATTGPNAATLVTPVRTTLPSAANNQPLVQIRLITTNAAGQDEWVGIDDIEVTADAAATGAGTCPPAPGPPPPAPPAPAPPAPGPPPPTPAPRDPPAISDLAIAPETFTPGRKGPAIVRRGGVRLRFRLSRAAVVRFDVTPVRGPKDLARRRQPSPITGGRFSVRAKRGLNRLRFSGRVNGRPLAPGRYFLTAVASDRAGKQTSQPRSVPFSITDRID